MTIIKPNCQNDDGLATSGIGAPEHARIRRGPREHRSIVNVIGPVYRYRLKVAEHYLAMRADGFRRYDAFDGTALEFGLDPDRCWHILNWMGVHPLPKLRSQQGNARYADSRPDNPRAIGSQIHTDNRKERDHHAQLH